MRRSLTKLEAEARLTHARRRIRSSQYRWQPPALSERVLAEWCSDPTKHHITFPFYMHTFDFQGHKQKHIPVFWVDLVASHTVTRIIFHSTPNQSARCMWISRSEICDTFTWTDTIHRTQQCRWWSDDLGVFQAAIVDTPVFPSRSYTSSLTPILCGLSLAGCEPQWFICDIGYSSWAVSLCTVISNLCMTEVSLFLDTKRLFWVFWRPFVSDALRGHRQLWVWRRIKWKNIIPVASRGEGSIML